MCTGRLTSRAITNVDEKGLLWEHHHGHALSLAGGKRIGESNSMGDICILILCFSHTAEYRNGDGQSRDGPEETLTREHSAPTTQQPPSAVERRSRDKNGTPADACPAATVIEERAEPWRPRVSGAAGTPSGPAAPA